MSRPLFASLITWVLAATLGSPLAFAQSNRVAGAAGGESGGVAGQTGDHHKNVRPILNRGASEADLTWQWSGEPRWLEGVRLSIGTTFSSSGETFFRSVARGRHVFGSSIGPSGDIPVEIVFSSSETSFVQTFRRDLDYEAAGVGTFPGAAYDLSDPANPRRLNLVIVEEGRAATPNQQWDPDASSRGKFEYALVMASSYDGTGETYAGADLDDDTLDVLYFWWPRLREGYSFFASDPASLQIRLARIADFSVEPANGAVTLTWNYAPPPEAESIVLYRGLASPAADPITILSPDATSYTVEGLDPEVRYYFRAEALDSDSEVIDISTEVRTRPLVSRNMALTGQLDPGSTYGDVWGYVDEGTGREYALLTARRDGLYVIDVTEDTPVEVGFVSGLVGRDGTLDAKDVKTFGSYAYLVNEYAPIQIIDLSDPSSPVQVGTLDVQPDVSLGGAHNVLVEDAYLYVVGGRSPGGLRIYSLDNPAAPAFVGDFQPHYYHDLEVRNDTVYAAAIYDQGVDIIDVSIPSAPSLISTFIYAANYMGAHNVCSTEDGSHVFVGDEIGSGTYTRVFDVRDPFDVEQVAEIIVDPESPVHNCYVDGNLLYIANYSEGVRVYDVSIPANPTEVAIFDTYLGQEVGFFGTWTVYPYLPSGKIIASDMQSGLYVLRLDSAAPNEPVTEPDEAFSLGDAYPNPSPGRFTVPFTIATAAHVQITLYDVLGRQVAMVTDRVWTAGAHETPFDGSQLPAGAYFYRLEVEGFETSTKRALTVVH